MFRKIAAITLSITLLGASVPAQALPTASWTSVYEPAASIGYLTDSYSPSATQTTPQVILIQDLHVNFQAQQNIQKLLTSFDQQFPQLTVAVEGAPSELHYDVIQKRVPAQMREPLVTFLMEQGEITGAEAFAILHPKNKSLMGVEYGKFYDYHLKLFQESYAQRVKLQNEVAQLSSKLGALKKVARRIQSKDFQANLTFAQERLTQLTAILQQKVSLQDAQQITQQLSENKNLIQTLFAAAGVKNDDVQTELSETLKTSVDYYVAALARDVPLAENTLKHVNASAPVALVVGGFHTAGITDIFKKKQVPYVVITPHIDSHTKEDEVRYTQRLLGIHTTQQEINTAFSDPIALGLIGGILKTNGLALVDSIFLRLRTYRQRSTSAMSRLANRGALTILASWGLVGLTSPAASGGDAPKWDPKYLSSPTALYRYTQSAIEHRIQEYASQTGTSIQTISDLKPQVSDAASFAKRNNLTPGTDFVVSEPDHTFDEKSVTPEAKRKVAQLILEGKMLHQLLMAGEASRMKKSIRDAGIEGVGEEEYAAMYWLNVGYLYGLDRDLPLGPRELLQLRLSIENLAKEYADLGITPEQAVANQPLLIHLNEKTAPDISKDLMDNDFYGFNPERVLLVAQHVNYPFSLEKGKVKAKKIKEKVALGHGWATLDAATKGTGTYVKKGKIKRLTNQSPLEFFVNQIGVEMGHQYRVNDLYNLSAARALDLGYLAEEYNLLQEGHHYIARLVANPTGQKGGSPLTITKPDWPFNQTIVVDSLAVKDAATDRLLDEAKNRNLPYHRFANTFSPRELLNALVADGLPVDFETKEFETESGKVELINPQYVTGMITALPSLNSISVHRDGEVLQDFKDRAKDERVAVALWQAQSDEAAFQEAAAPYIAKRQAKKADTYTPRHIVTSVVATAVGVVAVPVTIVMTQLSAFSLSGGLLIGLAALAGLTALVKSHYLVTTLSAQGYSGVELFKQMASLNPLATISQKTGIVTGLTGWVPLAHERQSHQAFGFHNEFLTHLMDVVAIPLAGIHRTIAYGLNRYSKSVRQLTTSPLAQALSQPKMALLVPANTTVNMADENNPKPELPTPSSLSARLGAFFGFNAAERKALQAARARLEILKAA